MSDNFTPGSDAQLTAALQAAAIAEASVPSGPLEAPKPLQSTGTHSPATAPDIRLLPTAADQGVTVNDGSEPVSFADAYANETDHTLGTEAAPADVDDTVDDTTATIDPENMTPEQRRIAELEDELATRDRQAILDQATNDVNAKWREGKAEFTGLENEVKAIGAREGKSEAEILNAVMRVRDDYSNWKDRYWPWRAEQLAIAEDLANGIDAITTIIEENGLQPSDRTRLQAYAKYGEDAMESVAKDIAQERAALSNLRTSARRQAARNKGAEMSDSAISPPASASPSNKRVVVSGSDAELEVMIANRPTRRGRAA